MCCVRCFFYMCLAHTKSRSTVTYGFSLFLPQKGGITRTHNSILPQKEGGVMCMCMCIWLIQTRRGLNSLAGPAGWVSLHYYLVFLVF